MKLTGLYLTLIAVFFALFSGCSGNGDGDPTSIELSTTWIAMTTSETRQLEATIYSDGNIVDADIEWISGDNSIATVSGGVISPVDTGIVEITALSGAIESEPCSVHIAEEWILYSDGTQLRVITPDNDRDMAIPGTALSEYDIDGPMVWLENGIAYHTLAPFNYSYLWYRPFGSEQAHMVTGDTIEPIYDIRPNLTGGIFLTVYQDIHTLNPSQTFSQYINADHLYYTRSGVKLEDFDISPDGASFVSACRLGTSPRFVLFDLDGAASEPTDTLPVAYMASCPRFNPTGDKIAYGYATTVGRVWLIETSGGSAVNIISEGQEVAGLDWSPDGTRLVMCIRNMVNEYELWIGDPETGATQKLTNAESSSERYFPQWVD